MGRVLPALAVFIVGFGGGIVARHLTQSAGRTKTVRTTTIELVNGSKAARRKPAPIPSLLDNVTDDPRELPLSAAVPVDANLLSAKYVLRPPQQLVVTWYRADLTRDTLGALWERYGVAIWQRERGVRHTFHRVYTRDERVNNLTNLHGFFATLGDVSGDGRPEVMVVEDTDGSAGCAIFHLLANIGTRVRGIYEKSLCFDQGTMMFAHDALVVYEGLDRYDRGVHCCYRKVREKWLRWNGRHMVTVHDQVHGNTRGWPPGLRP